MNPGLALLIAAVLVGGHAHADDAVILDRVTVLGDALQQFQQSTAVGSKLGLSIKETPASIEVIDADTLQQRGDSTVIRAVTKAAGITGGASGHGTAGNYSVRGFTGYPGVDFLQDGIKLNGTIFSKRTLDVANLERIEIIRGASSVLNGEGSVGATVNLVTKRPGFQEEGTEVGVKAGSHDSYRFNFGVAGVAIEDVLAYRIDGVRRRIGSNRSAEKRDLDALSAALLYRINDRLSASLSLDASRDEGVNDYQGTPLVNGRLDGRVRDINYNNLEDGLDSGDSLWLRAGIDWRPSGQVELRNMVYFQDASSAIRRLYLAVQDAAQPDQVNRRGYDSSQRQQLLGNRLDLVARGEIFGLRNKVLVGADLATLALQRQQSTYAGLILPTPMFNPQRLHYSDFFGPTTHDYKRPDADIELNQLGLYAEDQLSITPRLKVVAGLRYDIYDIDYDFEQGLSSPTRQSIDKRHDELSYRGGLVFDVSGATTLYASYASAFESGDASASFLTVSAAQTRLDLTKAVQYEIGLRQSFLDGLAEFTASAYRITKKNMFVSNPIPGAGVLSVGKQTAQGVELALGMRPLQVLQIDANLSYVDSRYDDFIHNGVDYAGLTPSSVPEYLANLGIRYMPVPHLGIGAWGRHVGAFHTDRVGFANSVKLPAYTTVDLTLDYTYADNTTFSFLLKNLTDELYATTARRDVQVFLGDARGVELGVSHRF